MEFTATVWIAIMIIVTLTLMWVYTMWSNNEAFRIMAKEIERLHEGKTDITFDIKSKKQTKNRPKRELNPILDD